jgi:hypothetical protein
MVSRAITPNKTLTDSGQPLEVTLAGPYILGDKLNPTTRERSVVEGFEYVYQHKYSLRSTLLTTEQPMTSSTPREAEACNSEKL